MALSIKNRDVETLAEEVAALTGETKTEAVRKALSERKQRLALEVARPTKGRDFVSYLKQEVWPKIPDDVRGRRLSREEREEILGYGSMGV